MTNLTNNQSGEDATSTPSSTPDDAGGTKNGTDRNVPAHCYGEWTKYTPCSRTCGGGVRMSYQHPVVSYTCRHATQPRERTKFCATEPCEIPSNYLRPATYLRQA